ncbi:MAG: 2-hydroxychromene-2-carboxylate isomerase [Alphaproteobacteria bacterium MarineAlpha9_Bin7]|nr:MAG: 2-hydroxychromene-2-carboxylate isomerase [Alphaproteobacteria bacterium MarineAlpha9_Bin7]
MTKEVEFLFDVGSPTAYLAYTQLPAIAEKARANIIWVPILLGGLFKAVGNQSPALLAPKSAWMASDLPRFARRYNVPYQPNKYFPINTLALMRGAVAADEDGFLQEYLAAVFPAMWAQSRKMDDPEVVSDTLITGGIDPEQLFARIGDQAVKDKLKMNTERAAERGAFGAPTFFVGGNMFFGQDRLDFVSESLTT